MNTSTATLEIAAELAIAIKTNAAIRRQSLDEYLRTVIELEEVDGEVVSDDAPEAAPTPNYAMLEALRKIAERSKDMPYTSGEDTQRILREGRAGAMWGYEPTE